MQKFICVHGHFYQPPRENPWLESVELQDSAAPYHDWNERIAAECYAPNATARIHDGEGKIASIVNTYSSISFNFGPTLLAWMKQAMPEIHQAIVEADARSRQRFSGHGSALAQPPHTLTDKDAGRVSLIAPEHLDGGGSPRGDVYAVARNPAGEVRAFHSVCPERVEG